MRSMRTNFGQEACNEVKVLHVYCESLFIIRNHGVQQQFDDVEAGGASGDIVMYV
jgi:hypothetical protein